MKKQRCYIAGKIGGLSIEDVKFNFDEAKHIVGQMGFEPVSPIDLPHEHGKTWEEYMREDLRAMLTCNFVYVLNNWRTSPGATIEVKTAMSLGINIVFQKEEV